MATLIWNICEIFILYIDFSQLMYNLEVTGL